VPPGSSELHFIHTDRLGTPLVATDELGEVVWRARYLPFGEAEVDEDPDGDGTAYELNLRLPGQYYDAESGLHYNYFRTYDPDMGRFIRPDPAGGEGGLNLYRYADNNPIASSDPLGLWVKRCSRQLGNPEGPNRSGNNPIRHDYLVVSGEILSFQAGNNWLWSQGRIDTGGEDPNRTCPVVCSDDAFDDFVLRAAATVGAPNYCLVATPGTLGHALGGRNCQTWADDVLKLARENYLKEIPCPRCFN
jgi:RHS repeat-associated protein